MANYSMKVDADDGGDDVHGWSSSFSQIYIYVHIIYSCSIPFHYYRMIIKQSSNLTSSNDLLLVAPFQTFAPESKAE